MCNSLSNCLIFSSFWISSLFIFNGYSTLLDCFVIGTLTDMVPLVDENRVLVKHGLLQLAQTKRLALKLLLQSLDLWGRPLNSQDIAFRLAPKINALSRMEKDILPIDLFFITDEMRAKRIVSDVIKNNELRRQLQKQAEEEALEALEEDLGESHNVLSQNPDVVERLRLLATQMKSDLGLTA